MPNEATAILDDVVGRGDIALYRRVIRNNLVCEFAGNGVHQGIVVAGTHHQPTFFVPTHRGKIVARYLGILSAPCSEFSCLGVEHL